MIELTGVDYAGLLLGGIHRSFTAFCSIADRQSEHTDLRWEFKHRFLSFGQVGRAKNRDPWICFVALFGRTVFDYHAVLTTLNLECASPPPISIRTLSFMR